MIAPISIAEIKRAVAGHYGVRAPELAGPRRFQPLCLPRHLAMYLARELTHRSLTVIGRQFGGRNHSTVRHACRKIARQAAEPEFAAKVAVIIHQLQPGAGV